MPFNKPQKIFIDLLFHLLSSFIFSSIIYLKLDNLNYVVIFILGSIFLDLDHLIDHSFYFKNKFRLEDFLNLTYLKSGKVYVFLHSWEIDFIIFVLGLIIGSKELLMLFLGITLHLVIDNLQRRNRFFYFLSYRIIKKFNVKTLLPEYNPSISP